MHSSLYMYETEERVMFILKCDHMISRVDGGRGGEREIAESENLAMEDKGDKMGRQSNVVAFFRLIFFGDDCFI